MSRILVHLASAIIVLLCINTDSHAHKITHNNGIAYSCSMAGADGWKSNAIINGKVDSDIMEDQITSRIVAMKKMKEQIKREYEDALRCLDNEIYELYEMSAPD